MANYSTASSYAAASSAISTAEMRLVMLLRKLQAIRLQASKYPPVESISAGGSNVSGELDIGYNY